MEMNVWDIQAHTGKKKLGKELLEDVELQVYDFFIIKTNLKVQKQGPVIISEKTRNNLVRFLRWNLRNKEISFR